MKLKIQFAGICTHFRYGVAAGVPHRVVLPDASKLTLGLLTVADLEQQTPAPYYLLPHFAQLQVNCVNADIPDWVKNGDVLAGIRLQVVNAIEQEMTYKPGPGYQCTPTLTDYVPGYTFSSDVVLSGRAALYFDLYGGEVTPTAGQGGAMQTVVTLTTEGRPELLVTPLARQDRPGRSYRWCIGNDGDSEVQLNVCNLELDEERQHLRDDQGFDFLLNYLTARGGIPQSISKSTPGLPPVLPTPTPPAICSHTPGNRVIVTPAEVTPSCSDSQYP